MTIFATIATYGLYVMLVPIFASLILFKKNISKLLLSIVCFCATFSLIMLAVYIFSINVIPGAIFVLLFAAITIWAGIKMIKIYKTNIGTK